MFSPFDDFTVATVSSVDEAIPAREAAAVSSALPCCVTAVAETPPPFWHTTQHSIFISANKRARG